MKKEEFMKIVRSKAKADLSEQEVAMSESIGDGIERALQMEQVERKAELDKLTAMLGAVEDGKTLAGYRDWETDRKSTRLNSSHSAKSRMPSSA